MTHPKYPTPKKRLTYEEEIRKLCEPPGKITGVSIDQAVEQIWAYVRENRNSLSSDRACMLIRMAVDAAVSTEAEERKKLQKELVAEKRKAKESLKKMRRLLAAAYAVDNEVVKEADE